MAIHPKYANAILIGTKKIEFRKRRLAADVATVVIYATAPVKRIVGDFAVAEIRVESPALLWSTFGHLGSIERRVFDDYYSGTESAAGILVGEVTRYPSPLALTDLDPQPAVPQSYSYHRAELVAQTRTAQPDRAITWLSR